MDTFSRIISIEDIEGAQEQMRLVGVHDGGLSIMAPKAVFRAVKIEDVSVTAANILKQDMLSRGGDAATSYGTIDHSAKKTDVLLFGTIAQFKSLIERLKSQQFHLPQIACAIERSLNNYDLRALPVLGMEFGTKTYVMGILNVTPDSFSDGGKYLSSEKAVARANEMISEGADIIDIGGESTRPGADEVDEEEELKRVIPVIEGISSVISRQPLPIISVDTRKSKVAEAAIKAGASIINDVSGLLFDRNMAEVAAAHKATVVIMHSKGTPKTMQDSPSYGDVVSEILGFFEKSIKDACRSGISEYNIILDPGIGFGKTVEHNLEVLKRLDEFRVFGLPVCVGTSRKSFIGKILGQDTAEQRDEGTLATIALAISKKVDIIRVHNVKNACRAAVISDRIVRGNMV